MSAFSSIQAGEAAEAAKLLLTAIAKTHGEDGVIRILGDDLTDARDNLTLVIETQQEPYMVIVKARRDA